jgi:hypothetical protein
MEIFISPLFTHSKRPADSAGLLFARQRPTLAGGNPQLPSALESLTSVFGMGTGVTFPPSSPDLYNFWDVFPENRMGEKTVNGE